MHRLRSLLGGLLLPGVLTVCARAADGPVTLPAPPPLTIAAARQTAIAQQPAVAAARASLHAAITRRDAIQALRVPTFIARDLPIRKQQSELGVAAADAGLRLAEMNASYGAAYCYLSYLYALEQEKVAADALAGLAEFRAELLKGDDKKETSPDKLTGEARKIYLQLETYQGIARTRQAEARLGAERALSALREAMGLPPEACLTIVRRGLPEVCVTLDKTVLLDLAATRRPEIAQAQLGLDVTWLEVEAQGRPALFAFRVNTFASGSDLHANPLPAGSFDNEYKPGAVGPEMPVTINGSKHHRVAQAEAWAARAGTVVERTKKLIGLETDQAFLRWVDATSRAKGYREALRPAVARVEELRAESKDNFAGALPVLLDAGALSSQVRADMNKARYEALLGLIQLERVTAGGFCARIDDAPSAADDAAAFRKEAEELIKKRKKD